MLSKDYKTPNSLIWQTSHLILLAFLGDDISCAHPGIDLPTTFYQVQNSVGFKFCIERNFKFDFSLVKKPNPFFLIKMSANLAFILKL